METFKKICKLIFLPHFIIRVLLTPIAIVLLIYAFVGNAHPILTYTSYGLSAYVLTLWCIKIPNIIAFFKTFKTRNKTIEKYFTDKHFQIKISLYGTLAINLCYVIFQLVLGLLHHSIWFYSMAAYYVLLSIMRFALLHFTARFKPGENMLYELCCYRLCGVGLLLTHIALTIIIIFITFENKVFHYSQITTIALAAYTFTAVTVAIINLFKYKKANNPVFSATKIVSLATSLVSMLTLESAMLTTFGQSEDKIFRQLMNGLSGISISVFILVVAIFMIVKSNKEIKKLTKLK